MLSLYLNADQQLFYSYFNRLENIECLNERTHTQSNTAAVAWVSSRDIHFADIQLPQVLPSSMRKQAIIFELEEQLLADLETLHFATTYAAEKTYVAAVPIVVMQQLLAAATTHNLYLQAVYPDIFLLPWPEDQLPDAGLSVYIEAEYLLVRTSHTSGFGGGIDIVPLVTHRLKQLDDEANIIVFVDYQVKVPAALAHLNVQTANLHQLMELADDTKGINLLQGDFKPISPFVRWVFATVPALIPAGVVVALLLVSTLLSYGKRYFDARAIETAALQIVTKELPQAGRQWRSYVQQQQRYFAAAKSPHLPWQQLSRLLPYLQHCAECKIESIDVDDAQVVITLFSLDAQDIFEQQSDARVEIVATSKKTDAYIYELRWRADS